MSYMDPLDDAHSRLDRHDQSDAAREERHRSLMDDMISAILSAEADAQLDYPRCAYRGVTRKTVRDIVSGHLTEDAAASLVRLLAAADGSADPLIRMNAQAVITAIATEYADMNCDAD